MIIKGFSISRGSIHAAHLLETEDNDHVYIQEIRGFVAADLHGAFKESQAIARGTRCKQHLFSCAFSPPESANLSTAQFMEAVDQTEQALGLDGQPRAVVFHEKDGRRHAHCVWSRIDAETMKAKHLSHWKTTLGKVSRNLHKEFGIEMPKGLRDKAKRSGLNFTQAEWQMAKRNGEDPRWLKALVQDCWMRSDDARSFRRSLEDHGLSLARGDRRGIVLLDHHGSVHSLARTLGVRTSAIKARLGEAEKLSSIEEVKAAGEQRMGKMARAALEEHRKAFARRSATIAHAKMEMAHAHRAARQNLTDNHKAQWENGTRARQARMPKGFKWLWSFVSGDLSKLKAHNQSEAKAQSERQERERAKMRERQLAERRALQEQMKQQREEQAKRLLEFRRDWGRYLRLSSSAQSARSNERGLERAHMRDRRTEP